VIFREAVLAFLGAGQDQENPDRDAYCAACKKAGPADCSACDPSSIRRL
jgi:hypothetical protein